jgi:hypothetical protein
VRKVLWGSSATDLTHFNTQLLNQITFRRPIRAREVLTHLGDFRDSPGAAIANEIWSDFPEDIRGVLLVVAQIGGDQKQLGFWTPIATNAAATVPGAPEAIKLVRPVAVFTDDLPDFPINCGVTIAKWTEFIRHSSTMMMVAFPILVHNDNKSGSVVHGVATINVANERWRRAHCRSWLLEAWKRVNHWYVTAFHAFTLSEVIGGRVSPGVFRDYEGDGPESQRNG